MRTRRPARPAADRRTPRAPRRACAYGRVPRRCQEGADAEKPPQRASAPSRGSPGRAGRAARRVVAAANLVDGDGLAVAHRAGAAPSHTDGPQLDVLAVVPAALRRRRSREGHARDLVGVFHSFWSEPVRYARSTSSAVHTGASCSDSASTQSPPSRVEQTSPRRPSLASCGRNERRGRHP